jgi:hypothetical protein
VLYANDHYKRENYKMSHFNLQNSILLSGGSAYKNGFEIHLVAFDYTSDVRNDRFA